MADGAQAQVLRELDGNWLECADTQGVFYYNSVTQQSVDTLPAELGGAQHGNAQPAYQQEPMYQATMPETMAPQPAAEAGASQVLRELAGNWLECVDAQGVFYFNQATQQTCETLPAELQDHQHPVDARELAPAHQQTYAVEPIQQAAPLQQAYVQQQHQQQQHHQQQHQVEPMHQPRQYAQGSEAAYGIQQTKKVEAKVLTQSYIPPAPGFAGQPQISAGGGIGQAQLQGLLTAQGAQTHSTQVQAAQIHQTQAAAPVYAAAQPTYQAAPNVTTHIPSAHQFHKTPEMSETYRTRQSQEDQIFFQKMQEIENQKQALDRRFQEQVHALSMGNGQAQQLPPQYAQQPQKALQFSEPAHYAQQPQQAPPQYAQQPPQPQMQYMATQQLPQQHAQHYQQQAPQHQPQQQPHYMAAAPQMQHNQYMPTAQQNPPYTQMQHQQYAYN